MTAAPDAAAVADYRAKHGFAPRVAVHGGGVYGVGSNAKNAALALEFAQDGAFVEQLAQAFGGSRYLSDAARAFIENWEVESYRQKVAAGA
jgi:rhamnose utilization protein RhaD (predicted bifunctional aldolase and dehydrogenase)